MASCLGTFQKRKDCSILGQRVFCGQPFPGISRGCWGTFCTAIIVFMGVVSVMLGSFFISYYDNTTCSCRGEVNIQNLNSFTEDN